jgi:hypothetical protein
MICNLGQVDAYTTNCTPRGPNFHYMTITEYTAFYPSKPFWAKSAINVRGIDFNDEATSGWFFEQMSEVVFSFSNDLYEIKVCRDGQMMLRMEALEQSQTNRFEGAIDMRHWGNYLDYLNTFFLLFDSATHEFGLDHFNLHEITNRDIFRVRYEDGKVVGWNVSTQSIASVFQQGRFLSNYSSSPNIPIENDLRISSTRRIVIELSIIEHTSVLFAQVVAASGMEKTFASFAKSLSEYKIGNYSIALVLSWFIVEEVVSQLWKAHLGNLNRNITEGEARIDSNRREFLIGRDIGLVVNLLELWDVLPYPLFKQINIVRGYRNKIVHRKNFELSNDEAELAIRTAHALIERISGIRFVPNMGFPSPGL